MGQVWVIFVIVKFRHFEELYLCSFLTLKPGKFTKFKALIPALTINFRELVLVKR